MQDDLRAELIKQFPSEVIETKDMTGKEYYACPTCKRAVATGTEKCQGCGQKLSWDNIRHENEAKGSKKAKIEFGTSNFLCLIQPKSNHLSAR